MKFKIQKRKNRPEPTPSVWPTDAARSRAPACKGGIGETEHSRPQASSPETYFVLRATVTSPK